MEEKHKWLHIFKINVTNNKTETFMILASVEGWLNYQLLQGGDISFSYINYVYGSLFPMVAQTIYWNNLSSFVCWEGKNKYKLKVVYLTTKGFLNGNCKTLPLHSITYKIYIWDRGGGRAEQNRYRAQPCLGQ